MISSIQLSTSTKKALDDIKKSPKESYEEVIISLIKEQEQKKKEFEELMIEGAKETAEESLRITKEFESIEEDFDWEWDGPL